MKQSAAVKSGILMIPTVIMSPAMASRPWDSWVSVIASPSRCLYLSGVGVTTLLSSV